MKKIYWKIFPLSSIAILSIPILLSSCSSINNAPIINVSTIFASKGNVSSNSDLNNLLPSEYATNISQNYILNFIYNNVIDGKKDSILINNLNFISAIPNDNLGTLIVKYSVRNYWKDNIQKNDALESEVILEGFAKKTDPTEFKNSASIVDITSSTELSQLSTNELKDNKDLLQKFLFNNEVLGNKTSLEYSNIVITNFFNGDSELGTISLNYEINKYWSNKGIILNDNKNFSINLSGFKKVKLTDDQILEQINYGGDFGKLTIDKFLPIVQYLQITEKTRLNNLDINTINQQLKLSPNFLNITLAINSANQSEKKISFQISGTYKNIQIPSNEIININGFYNSVDNYEEFSKFTGSIYIYEIGFNFNNFFKNLQTKDNIKSWTSNDWTNTYLSKLTIQKFPTTSSYISFNLIDYLQNKIFENITFNNVKESINSSSWRNLSINVDYANYKYNSTTKSWDKIIDSFNKTLNFKSHDSLKFNTPSDKDAIDWTAENATNFNNVEIAKYFASNPYSNYQNDDNVSFNGLITIDENIKNKYFNMGDLILTLDSMSIDDWDGSMFISYKLDYNESQLLSKPWNLQTTGFKKLSEFVSSSNSSTSTNNLIQVNTTDPKNRLASNIIKSIKNEFTTEQLKSLKIDEVNNMTSSPILFKNQNRFNLFNGEKSTQDKLDTAYLNNIDVYLFNTKISNRSISIVSNLFTPNSKNEDRFIMNSIYIEILSETKPTLTRSNTSFTYKVPFKYMIFIESSSKQFIEIDSYYFATLLNSDLGL